jgi:hypothetical protein
MKTVNQCPVLLLKENEETGEFVIIKKFASREECELDVSELLHNNQITPGKYFICPLYWKLDIEIIEPKAKIKIT